MLTLGFNQIGGASLQKDSHGDIVANTLSYYRERTKSDDSLTPKPYLEIQKKMQRLVDNGKKVLIDIKDSYSVQTVVVRLEYAGNSWALGKSVCYLDGQEVLVPYTIHYSDIFCKKLKVKLIVEGDNPFAKR